MLQKHGYDVEILDTLIAHFPPRKEDNIKQYGMPWEKIKEELRTRKPDVVGITNPFTAQIENAIKVSEIVKNVNDRILTVIGGPTRFGETNRIFKRSGTRRYCSDR